MPNMRKVITKSGLGFRAFPTTLAYLRDIKEDDDEGLRKFYVQVLLNDQELNESNLIPKKLQNARPVRDLVLDFDQLYSAHKVSNTQQPLLTQILRLSHSLTVIATLTSVDFQPLGFVRPRRRCRARRGRRRCRL